VGLKISSAKTLAGSGRTLSIPSNELIAKSFHRYAKTAPNNVGSIVPEASTSCLLEPDQTSDKESDSIVN